ncbi:MAG: hypothetical protein ACOCP8_00970 [archaeon]
MGITFEDESEISALRSLTWKCVEKEWDGEVPEEKKGVIRHHTEKLLVGSINELFDHTILRKTEKNGKNKDVKYYLIDKEGHLLDRKVVKNSLSDYYEYPVDFAISMADQEEEEED